MTVKNKTYKNSQTTLYVCLIFRCVSTSRFHKFCVSVCLSPILIWNLRNDQDRPGVIRTGQEGPGMVKDDQDWSGMIGTGQE